MTVSIKGSALSRESERGGGLGFSVQIFRSPLFAGGRGQVGWRQTQGGKYFRSGWMCSEQIQQ
jgi:hypothetical protein